MENDMYQWLENCIKEYYQFVRVLKKDAGKEILLYRHKELGKLVVVKKMEKPLPVYLKLVDTKHASLTQIYEVAVNDVSTLILEEYVDGVSIADLLETKTFSNEVMLRIAMQLCEGLYVLHINHIIHRDIKPENIWMLQDGTVKLMDFDASRIYREYEGKDTVVLGTVGYAAPEQYGEAQTDERTDIYALGILMNVMLTGKHPVQEMAGGAIGKIIEKCIMVNPRKRYASVLEVKKQLEKIRY